jgi:hypothetical protein
MSMISTRVREEGVSMSTYSTISDRTAYLPELPLRAIVPTPARFAVRPIHAHPAQMTQVSWPQMGMASARGEISQHDQGGRIVGIGGCDVTNNKCSPRVGPPSCSPPV